MIHGRRLPAAVLAGIAPRTRSAALAQETGAGPLATRGLDERPGRVESGCGNGRGGVALRGGNLAWWMQL